MRKINSIRQKVPPSPLLNIVEQDICASRIMKEYGLTVAHLLLGEAAKFGNPVALLLERLMQIRSKYFIVIDYVEDPGIDYEEVDRILARMPVQILEKTIEKNDSIQIWPGFAGTHNVGYFIRNHI